MMISLRGHQTQTEEAAPEEADALEFHFRGLPPLLGVAGASGPHKVPGTMFLK